MATMRCLSCNWVYPDTLLEISVMSKAGGLHQPSLRLLYWPIGQPCIKDIYSKNQINTTLNCVSCYLSILVTTLDAILSTFGII